MKLDLETTKKCFSGYPMKNNKNWTASVYNGSVCPNCGYSKNMNLTAMTNKTTELFNALPNRIKDIVKRASLSIQEALPSDRDISVKYKFLSRIKDCEEEVIYKQTYSFLQSKQHESGKGFLYLAAMITNYGKNIDKLKKNERLKRGATPPVKSIGE